MTDLTLSREGATLSGPAALVQILKEMFSATPLGLVLGAVAAR